jgi:hypothetical protein
MSKRVVDLVDVELARSCAASAVSSAVIAPAAAVSEAACVAMSFGVDVSHSTIGASARASTPQRDRDERRDALRVDRVRELIGASSSMRSARIDL